jgi:hypothetical protein
MSAVVTGKRPSSEVCTSFRLCLRARRRLSSPACYQQALPPGPPYHSASDHGAAYSAT